jgi:UMF1 family MFS transporter
METFRRNNPTIINAWSMFDWANSSFALVITVAIFPAYFMAVTHEEIQLAGIQLSNSALYAYAISFSYLMIAGFSPLLSGIADYGGKRKFFLKSFTIMGSMACISLFFFTGMENLWLGTTAFIIAMIGFAGGLVFYNSYLHDIVTQDRYDKTSAKGFAFGFTGSVILLILNLTVIFFHESLGIANQQLATRFAFVSVGIWWLGFALIPFKYLPNDLEIPYTKDIFKKGSQELRKVWKELHPREDIKRYLIAFFFYSAGVQTVLFLAATFAEKELKFTTEALLTVILLLQIIAIFGGFGFAFLSSKIGNIKTILWMMLIWIIICLSAFFVQSQMPFYWIASLVGLMMGGIQSLSRSTYAKLIPKDTTDTTSYFSFYDVLEKIAIVLGTFAFGFIDQITGNMRISVLFLTIFFILGILFLTQVRRKNPSI